MLESGAIQARGGTFPGRMLDGWALSLSRKAAPCMYTVSVYKLAHIRAVHTINETGHGYGLSLGAGFLSLFPLHTGTGVGSSPRRPPLCRDIGHELFNDRLMSS